MSILISSISYARSGGISEEKKKELDELVVQREATGIKMHYAPRDVVQEDPVGLRICTEHRDVMKHAGKMVMKYDPTSEGSVFDVGMGFVREKPLLILNPEDIVDRNNAYNKFLLDYASNGISDNFLQNKSAVYKELVANRHFIQGITTPIKFVWRPDDWKILFNFGMIFGAEKPFYLLNRFEVEPQRTPYKSYTNVVLALDDIYTKNFAHRK